MSKSILLLGSGFVAKPTVDVLANTPGYSVTVACRTLSKAQELISGIENTKAISVDVKDIKSLDDAVSKHDIVISLIPYTHHVDVIKSAIKFKKNVVTTSYISPAIQQLEEEIKKAGIIVMNEIGLDPGIDHLYAIKTISEVHQEGGKIESFLSYCGGLPAPEDSDNPLGYKFSWSCRGALLALRNSAKFYKDGKVEEINGKDLMDHAKPYFIYPGYAFVAYPNRDSTPYKERYNIPEAETIIRGTLRYQGFPEFIRTLVDLGFLSDEPVEYLNSPLSWKEAFAKLLSSNSSSDKDIEWAISSKTSFSSTSDKERIFNGMRWLGMFSNKPIKPCGNPLDVLCALFEEKMSYSNGERDFVILQHKFGILNKDGTREIRTSTLCKYGQPYGQQENGGYSAMAQTVGIPCAIATRNVLKGVINTPGLLAPLTPEINNPIMKELKEKYGIYLKEETLPFI